MRNPVDKNFKCCGVKKVHPRIARGVRSLCTENVRSGLGPFGKPVNQNQTFDEMNGGTTAGFVELREPGRQAKPLEIASGQAKRRCGVEISQDRLESARGDILND